MTKEKPTSRKLMKLLITTGMIGGNIFILEKLYKLFF